MYRLIADDSMTVSLLGKQVPRNKRPANRPRFLPSMATPGMSIVHTPVPSPTPTSHKRPRDEEEWVRSQRLPCYVFASCPLPSGPYGHFVQVWTPAYGPSYGSPMIVQSGQSYATPPACTPHQHLEVEVNSSPSSSQGTPLPPRADSLPPAPESMPEVPESPIEHQPLSLLKDFAYDPAPSPDDHGYLLEDDYSDYPDYPIYDLELDPL